MARNRKYQPAAIRFGPAVKAFLLCLVIGGSGVGYVWQKTQIWELGEQFRKREKELVSLQNQNEMLKKQLAKMCLQGWLEGKIKELNLGLVQPQVQQKWLVHLPTPAEPARESESEKPEAPNARGALTLR